ncbi:unnamed protein product [Larinioides sclopetarius]|uniref:Uncharacterized protein n=1 Tax=Larinioides sclopetarius TaxID=280406 RepID=A0AAV1ZUD9_9ARAC
MLRKLLSFILFSRNKIHGKSFLPYYNYWLMCVGYTKTKFKLRFSCWNVKSYWSATFHYMILVISSVILEV